MGESPLELLLASSRLPSPPAVALQVLNLVQEPGVSVTALASTIGNDPALSTKVLRMANSSFYAQSRKIATVGDAIVVLGLNSVRTLALGFSLVDNLRAHQGDGFDHDAFWRRSLIVATAARSIAAPTRPARKEEAFFGGLLLNLGVLAMASGIEDYGATFRMASGRYDVLSELDHARYDVTHQEVGAALVEAWNLPAQLAGCMLHYARPEDAAADVIELVRVVGIGDALAELCTGSAFDVALHAYRARVAWVGLSSDEADALVGEVAKSVQVMEALFGLQDGTAIPPSALLARANDGLGMLSLQATQDASRLVVENHELAVAASTDPLTGVANRRRFEEFTDDQYQIAMRYGGPFSVLFVDMDGLKRLNDTHGHAIGDRVLVAVATALHTGARAADLVARLGGDEFALALHSTTLNEAAVAAERIRAAVAEVRILTDVGESLGITVSIGVAQLDAGQHADAAALVSAADAAVYRAKQLGRNQVFVAEGAIAA